MGGSFRESINYKTTHLVSGYACSVKSQYAYLHEIPVIGSSWVHAAWERRDEMEFKAINTSFVSIKTYDSKTRLKKILVFRTQTKTIPWSQNMFFGVHGRRKITYG